MILKPFAGNKKCSPLSASMALGLVLCHLPTMASTQTLVAPQKNIVQMLATVRSTLPKEAGTEALNRVASALDSAAALDFRQASQSINAALQMDARNSYLHFFNGFIYHMQARQGDSDKTDLAIQGYLQAARFDPSNWIAQEFLGLALMEQKQYARAQSAFAEVLVVRPDDTVVLARMLAASYMAGDSRTACAMADQLALQDVAKTPSFKRHAVSVYAACGEFDKASTAQLEFEEAGNTVEDVQQSGRRLSQWQSFFRSKANQNNGPMEAGEPGLLKTQFQDPGVQQNFGFGQQGFGGGQQNFGGGQQGFGGGQGAMPNSAPSSGDSRMILVDVVMVRTEDSVATTKGVNLLNALTLQFGSTSAAAFSENFSETSGQGGSTVVTRAITIPALAYSLNIANANSNLNEVLARPTLAAVEGLRSEFFSGTSLNAAVVSNGGVGAGSAISLEKRYGVKMSVLPQILPNGMVKLSIDASRTFLKAPSANIGFTYKLEISEILANANVVMRMGETLVLGGLSEKESTTNRDGVPVLQDLPGLQYFFSQQQKTDFQRSVLILITPRPATYTWQGASDSAATGGTKANPNNPDASGIDVLRARYSDWFKPHPNLASVFHHLSSTDLYREFRTGDVTLERWDRMDTTRQRLQQALGFLYY
jgi:pilus assembly protein CpaC